MNSYLSLVPAEAKAHRKQNRMTVLCIVIAVFLVTGVFSLCNMAVKMEYDSQLAKNGSWHICAREVGGGVISDTDALRIMDDGVLKTAARYDVMNYDLDKDYRIGEKQVCIVGTDDSFFDLYEMGLDGSLPSDSGSIILTENISDIYGLGIGDSVTLTFPDGSAQYRISGLVSTNDMINSNDCIGAIVSIDAYKALCDMTGTQYRPCIYLELHKTLRTGRAVDDLVSGYSITDYSENPAVMGMAGSSSSEYITGLYGVAALIVLLVMLAGVLMIAGSMNTNVSQRTQFFGMLRCIGAGKDQIKRIVRREALSLCIEAVPAGIFLGILVSWGIGAVLKYGIGGEWVEFPVFMVSAVGITAGVVIGIATVLIASSKPARNAARVSPILAVSGNSTDNTRFTKAAQTDMFSIETALGIHHAKSSKRNLLLMTGSFALSIVLFLGFSVIIEWIGFALNTLQPYSSEISISSPGYVNEITKEQTEAIADIPGIKRAFGRMYVQPEVSCTVPSVSRIDLISYDEQQFIWAKRDLVEGDIDRVMNERNAVLTVFDKLNPLALGDVIYYNGERLEIAAVLSDSPFSTDDIPIIICSEGTFTALSGTDGYATVDVQVEKNCPDEVVAEIRGMFGDAYRISDAREELKSVNDTYYAFVTVAYSFLAMIALISVFNIVNSISMSVNARLKQCGVMRAIGMDERQIMKMTAGEALFYCLCGITAGCAVGLPMNALFYDRIITHYFGKQWSVPFGYLFLIIAVVAAAGVISIYGPSKRLHEMTITETINAM